MKIVLETSKKHSFVIFFVVIQKKLKSLNKPLRAVLVVYLHKHNDGTGPVVNNLGMTYPPGNFLMGKRGLCDSQRGDATLELPDLGP